MLSWKAKGHLDLVPGGVISAKEKSGYYWRRPVIAHLGLTF